MEGKVALVCATLAMLGTFSAALSFGAEYTRIKAYQVYIEYGPQCVYPSSPAKGLAIGAAVSVLFARIILGFVIGRCACCHEIPNSKYSSCARVCSTFSWVASVLAMALLFGGAALNSKQGVHTTSDGEYICYISKAGVFTAGGILSFAGVFLGIIYYIVLSKASETSTTNSPSDIPLASVKVEKAPTLQQK